MLRFLSLCQSTWLYFLQSHFKTKNVFATWPTFKYCFRYVTNHQQRAAQDRWAEMERRGRGRGKGLGLQQTDTWVFNQPHLTPAEIKLTTDCADGQYGCHRRGNFNQTFHFIHRVPGLFFQQCAKRRIKTFVA